MNKFMEFAARTGKKHAYAIAAIALASLVSGCQSMDAMATGSIGGKPVVQTLGKKVNYVKKKRLHLLNRKQQTQITSMTRTSEWAYAASLKPQRISVPAPMKVSYSLGDSGPLLGRSPWICSPSGFGQRSSCRSRY